MKQLIAILAIVLRTLTLAPAAASMTYGRFSNTTGQRIRRPAACPRVPKGEAKGVA